MIVSFLNDNNDHQHLIKSNNHGHYYHHHDVNDDVAYFNHRFIHIVCLIIMYVSQTMKINDFFHCIMNEIGMPYNFQSGIFYYHYIALNQTEIKDILES